MHKIYKILIMAFAFFLMPIMEYHVYAQTEELVGSVKIEGNKRVDTSTLLFYIKTRKGEALSRKQIGKDIEKIYGLGQFKDIRVETRQGSEGLEVVFIVEEIPSIGNVMLYGNKEIEDGDIHEIIGFKRGEAFQAHMMTDAKEKINSLYNEKGFFFATVDVVSKISERNLMNIHVRVREGEKVGIKNIRFSGNKNFSDGDLSDQIETKAETWISFLDESGLYKKDTLKLDVFRLEGYYQDHGYIRVRVQDPKIDIDRESKEINISIPIDEGLQYRVGKVTSKEDDIVTEDEVLKALKMKMRDVYSISKLRAGVMNIGDLYSERGYAYADVNPITKINESSRTVDVNIEIDRGRKVYVGEITVIGNTRTLDNVIRREFRLKEG